VLHDSLPTDILPIIHLAIESPTHSIVDASLRSLPVILPVMDFSTIKNELFPVIAAVFSKTSSLGIKVRGLEAFVILCGGTNDPAASNDGLNGIMNANATKKSSSTALDKYTMQEKIVPLIRAIKTKEPAVGIAALNVLRQVGGIADADFVAMDILPVLWSMSLGPLLNLQQFQAFMELIKSLSARVESEQSRKLQELSGSNGSQAKGNDDFMSFGAPNAFASNNGDGGEIDFERLVKGSAGDTRSTNPLDSAWDSAPNAQPSQNASNQGRAPTPSFSWSTPSPTAQSTSVNLSSMTAMKPQQGPASRTITPDLSRFDSLTPSSTQFSQPLQPQPNYGTPLQPRAQSSFAMPLQHQTNYSTQPLQPQPISSFQNTPSVNWGSTANANSNPWSTNPISPPPNPSLATLGNSMSNLSMNQPRPAMNSQNSFSLPPPPGANLFKPPPQQSNFSSSLGNQGQASAPKKSGLDAYESLI
jgi:SCY1-like protein 2